MLTLGFIVGYAVCKTAQKLFETYFPQDEGEDFTPKLAGPTKPKDDSPRGTSASEVIHKNTGCGEHLTGGNEVGDRTNPEPPGPSGHEEAISITTGSAASLTQVDEAATPEPAGPTGCEDNTESCSAASEAPPMTAEHLTHEGAPEEDAIPEPAGPTGQEGDSIQHLTQGKGAGEEDIPECLLSQLMSCDSVFELKDAEKVYAECGQQRPLPWDECIPPQQMQKCIKIGEGTFGEIFSTTNVSGELVALKIIPIESSKNVNGEDQRTFGEILHEIVISRELSNLKEKQQNQTHGFVGLKDLHCVQGCYPPALLRAWDTFAQQKNSLNERPDIFEKDQLFIILEFEFGGITLDNCSGTVTSLGVAKSILHQVTAALTVAEQELHFEHRDLHLGNVLVKTTKQKKGCFFLNGEAHSFETRGVLVSIIDYTLSRLEINDLTVFCDISEDEELFTEQGDYQFEIYRLMRQENGNNWSNYHPHTNVLWLHYLCSKLLSMKYRGSGGRGAKNMREELTRFYDNVLQYSSATEALQNCPMFQ